IRSSSAESFKKTDLFKILTDIKLLKISLTDIMTSSHLREKIKSAIIESLIYKEEIISYEISGVSYHVYEIPSVICKYSNKSPYRIFEQYQKSILDESVFTDIDFRINAYTDLMRHFVLEPMLLSRAHILPKYDQILEDIQEFTNEYSGYVIGMECIINRMINILEEVPSHNSVNIKNLLSILLMIDSLCIGNLHNFIEPLQNIVLSYTVEQEMVYKEIKKLYPLGWKRINELFSSQNKLEELEILVTKSGRERLDAVSKSRDLITDTSIIINDILELVHFSGSSIPYRLISSILMKPIFQELNSIIIDISSRDYNVFEKLVTGIPGSDILGILNFDVLDYFIKQSNGSFVICSIIDKRQDVSNFIAVSTDFIIKKLAEETKIDKTIAVQAYNSIIVSAKLGIQNPELWSAVSSILRENYGDLKQSFFIMAFQIFKGQAAYEPSIEDLSFALPPKIIKDILFNPLKETDELIIDQILDLLSTKTICDGFIKIVKCCHLDALIEIANYPIRDSDILENLSRSEFYILVLKRLYEGDRLGELINPLYYSTSVFGYDMGLAILVAGKCGVKDQLLAQFITSDSGETTSIQDFIRGVSDFFTNSKRFLFDAREDDYEDIVADSYSSGIDADLFN
ncbi:MAG: hypothetical protein RLZZ59_669, partial [Pseudomonadota bacterium]